MLYGEKKNARAKKWYTGVEFANSFCVTRIHSMLLDKQSALDNILSFLHGSVHSSL